MSKLIKKYIGAKQVGSDQIELENNKPLRGQDSEGQSVDILKINEEDKLEMLQIPHIPAGGTEASQAVRRDEVDAVKEALQERIGDAEDEIDAIEQELQNVKNSVGGIDMSPYFKKDGSVQMEGDITFKGVAQGQAGAYDLSAEELNNYIGDYLATMDGTITETHFQGLHIETTDGEPLWIKYNAGNSEMESNISADSYVVVNGQTFPLDLITGSVASDKIGQEVPVFTEEGKLNFAGGISSIFFENTNDGEADHQGIGFSFDPTWNNWYVRFNYLATSYSVIVNNNNVEALVPTLLQFEVAGAMSYTRKIKGIANGTDANDAVNLGQVQQMISGSVKEAKIERLLAEGADHAVTITDKEAQNLYYLDADEESYNLVITLPEVTVDGLTYEFNHQFGAPAIIKNHLGETMVSIPSSRTVVFRTIDGAYEGQLFFSGDADLNINMQGKKIVGLANGTSAQDAVNKSQLDAVASAVTTGLKNWRGAFLVSEDLELVGAEEGDTLASILPMGDDEAPALELSDFEEGMLLLAKDGANSKLMKVIDDEGTLKVTFVDQTLNEGDSFIVKHDLIDSPDSRENLAIYHFNGEDLIKLADMDFSMATQIGLGSWETLVAQDNAIVVTDSVQQALHKLAESLLKEKADRAEADLAFLKLDGSRQMKGTLVFAPSEGEPAKDHVVRVSSMALSMLDFALTIDGVTVPFDSELGSLTAENYLACLEAHAGFLALGIEAEVDGSDLLLSRATEFDVTIYDGVANIVVAQEAEEAVDGEPVHQIKGVAPATDANDVVIKSQLDAVMQAVIASAIAFELETITLTAQNITEGYVDTTHNFIPKSLRIGVGERVNLYQGLDFTATEVSGKTRIIFTGPSAYEGANALEMGQVLYLGGVLKPVVDEE